MKWVMKTLVLGAVLLFGVLAPAAEGEMVDFPAGSLIVPMDSCWQPNGDGAMNYSFRLAGCDAGVDDRGIFQAYGLVIELLRRGCPVAWVIRPDKADRQELDFIIDGRRDGIPSAPVSRLAGADSTPLDPPARTVRWIEGGHARIENFAAHVVDYRGGPFVIHRQDLDENARSVVAAFAGVKVHRAEAPFSAPVAKLLQPMSGEVAVLGDGNRAMLHNFLRGAGLVEGESLALPAVPPSLLADRPLDGERFSLVWAPHWDHRDEGLALGSGRQKVVDHLRQFLVDGNSAFLGCAAVGSLEGLEDLINPARNIGSAAPAGAQGWLAEGLLTPAGAEDERPALGLLEEGDGRSAESLVYGGPAAFLAQCAGWEFRPSGGRIGRFRPRPPPSSAGYNGTVTRLVHDADDPAVAQAGFDFLIGGRLFGGPDHGVAGYLAGHDHLRCRTDYSLLPQEPGNELVLSLDFDGVLPAASTISLRVEHDGNPEPLIAQFRVDGGGLRSGDDARLMIDLDHIVLDRRDGRTTAGNLLITNLDATPRTVTGILIDWSGCADDGGNNPAGCGDSFRLLIGPDSTPFAGRKNVTLPGRWTLASMNPGGKEMREASLGPLASFSTCAPDWRHSNTCGARFVYNALLGLQRPSQKKFAIRAAPALDDGLLVVGSFQRPGHQGRLQAYDLREAGNRPLWDAQEAMPPAGIGNPAVPSAANPSRYLFTAAGGDRLPFEAAAVDDSSSFLHRAMGLATVPETRAWINTLRGRTGATPAHPSGTAERSHRLGGIRESTPAVVGGMPLLPEARHRDRLVYVGADDGMLHAFQAGSWDSSTGYTPGNGREVWAFLPSSLLPYLKYQDLTDPTASSAVAVSGAPAVVDVLLPVAGGQYGETREWRTILVGTANIAFHRSGVCFALDITDPYDPRVLWEREFPVATNLGWSRGAAIGLVQDGGRITQRVFLSAGYRDRLDSEGQPARDGGNYGIHALALDLFTGEMVWQFRRGYDRSANLAGPPAIPALLDHDDNGSVDFLVFGDLDGRLWVLNARDGTSVRRVGETDQPVFPQPEANGRIPDLGPIENGVALVGDLVIFGTGGSEFAGGETSPLVHGVRIDRSGLVAEIWVAGSKNTGSRDFLEAGEKIQGSPVVDSKGRVYLTTSQDLAGEGPAGRIRILDLEGRLLASSPTGEMTSGGMAVADGVAVATDAAGESYILGTPSPDRETGGVKVKVFSWRLR